MIRLGCSTDLLSGPTMGGCEAWGFSTIWATVDMDPIWAHNTTPIQNKVSAPNMALLPRTLTLAHSVSTLKTASPYT